MLNAVSVPALPLYQWFCLINAAPGSRSDFKLLFSFSYLYELLYTKPVSGLIGKKVRIMVV